MCFIYSKLAEKSPQLPASSARREALAKPVSLLLLLEVESAKVQLRGDLVFNGPNQCCWPLMGSSPARVCGSARPPCSTKENAEICSGTEPWLHGFF